MEIVASSSLFFFLWMKNGLPESLLVCDTKKETKVRQND